MRWNWGWREDTVANAASCLLGHPIPLAGGQPSWLRNENSALAPHRNVSCVAMITGADKPAVAWQTEGRVKLRCAGGFNFSSSSMQSGTNSSTRLGRRSNGKTGWHPSRVWISWAIYNLFTAVLVKWVIRLNMILPPVRTVMYPPTHHQRLCSRSRCCPAPLH